MKSSFEQILIEVWRQALVENARVVELDGSRYPVRRTRKRGLRQVDFVFDGNEIRGLEQNPAAQNKTVEVYCRLASKLRSGTRMKSFFPIKCQCGHEHTLETVGTEPFKDTTCPSCGSAMIIVDDGFASWRIYNKARQFLMSGDYTLSTVLGAVAVESELARVYIKWRSIETGLPYEITDADRENFEDELRKCFKIVDRLDMVSEYLTKLKFNEFVQADADVSDFVLKAHPESATNPSLKKFFEEELFWRRNAIAHAGKIDSTKQQGEKCFNAANTMFKILATMDAAKLKTIT